MSVMGGALVGSPKADDGYDETLTAPPRLPWVLICHRCCARAWTVNEVAGWVVSVADRLRHEESCQGALKPARALG